MDVVVNSYFFRVPEGSVLGPVLRNIYLNDIINNSKLPSYIIYADDTSLFFPSSEICDLMHLANIALSKLF